MVPDRRVDIRFRDLFAGMAACVLPRRLSPAPLLDRPDALECFTVRSGFELLLGALALPAGSEVLVSAIVLPDLVRLLREHGLVPVPIDVDPRTLEPDLAELDARITDRTRALLLTHLFGARVRFGPAIARAHERGLLVFEDCAQAFEGADFVGHEESDVRFFSFGMMKTATAAGGAVVLVRDPALRAAMAAEQETWPMQPAREFAFRLLKVLGFKVLLRPLAFAIWLLWCRARGVSHDDVLLRASRAFPGDEALGPRLRRRPAHALSWLLRRRLGERHEARIEARARRGRQVREAIPHRVVLGDRAERQTFWLFPLVDDRPDDAVRFLRARGIDASRSTTQVMALDAPAERPDAVAPRAAAAMRSLLFVPIDERRWAVRRAISALDALDRGRGRRPGPLRVGIFGAGAVGGLLGLRLAAAGADVLLVGRSSELPKARLPDGRTLAAAPGLRAGSAADLRDVDACLVTVKAGDTADAAEELARVLPEEAVVISFQNGLRSAGILCRALRNPVARGVVAFNVARAPNGTIVQTTRGRLFAERLEGAAGALLEAVRDVLAPTDLPLALRRDIAQVAASKLLVNLNNGVGAATGLSVRDALRSEDARRCFSLCMTEGLRVLRAAGIRPSMVYGLPPALFAMALRLPNAIFLRLARRVVSMDPSARSSTLQDLDRGRPTEIDALNGEIVRLAGAHGVRAPMNAIVVDVVRAHERRACAGRPPEFLAPAELCRALLEGHATSRDAEAESVHA